MGHDHKRPTRPATKKNAPGSSEAPAGRRSGKGRHGVASHRQIERYQALLANIPDVTWTSDAQGNIVFVSPNIEQMYGFTPEEVCRGGRADWLKRIHPDDVAQVKQAFQSFFAHGSRLDVEYRIQRKDGRWIWVHDKAVATYEEDGTTLADGILTDITEPRQTIDTLWSTEERLRHLFLSSPAVIYSCQPSGNFAATYISPNITSQLGYEIDEILGDPDFWMQRIHPDDAPRVLAELLSVYKDGHHALEYRFLHKDGNYRWMSDEMMLVRDSDGNPHEIVGYWIDITDRKQAEVALRESEERYRAVFEQAGDSIVMTDADTGKITEFNQRAHRNLGYTREEFSKLKLADLDVLESTEDVAKHVEKIAKEGLDTFLTKHQTKEGQIREILVSSKFLTTSKRRLISSIWHDMTEQKQAEEALRAAYQERAAILDSMSELVIYQDMEHRVIWANKAVGKSVGLAPEELVGRYCYDILAQRTEPCEGCPVIRTHKTGQTEQGEITTPSGRTGFIRAHPICNAEGQPVGVVEVVDDITERRRAEKALRESEQRLRMALSAAQMGTWRWDARANHDTRDASLNQILGLTAADSTQPVEDLLERVHPGDRLSVEQEIHASAREHRPYLAEFRIVRPDGEVRWLRDQGKGFYDNNGEFSHMTGAVVDITERKRAEEEFKKFKTIADQAVHGIAISNLDGNLIYVNGSFAQMHGGVPEEYIGKNLSVFHHDEQMEHINALNERLSVHGSFVGEEVWHVKRDGTPFPTLMSATIITDHRETPVFLAATAIDITERKWAEESLRVKTEQLGAIADAMTLFVDTGEWKEPTSALLRYALDRTGSELAFFGTVVDGQTLRIHAYEGVAWLEEAERDLYDRAQRAHQETGYFELTYPETLIGAAITSCKAVISNDPNSDPRASGVPPGHPPLRRFLGIPVLRGQKVVGLIALANAARPYDEQDVSVIDTLADAVGVLLDSYLRRERETHLQRQLQHSERLASIGTLAAGIAHEINNPVGTALVAAQFALQCADEPDARQITQTALQDIADDLRRAGRIVHGLLQFARQEPTDKWLCDLNGCLRSAVNLTQREAQERSARIELILSNDMPEIPMNPTAIQQVFVNVIRNALQMGGSGTCITIRTEHCSGMVRTSVDDDGPGITEEQKKRLFDPFYTTRQADGGTGLGLSMSHGIVREHGGKIDVVSQGGRGATVIVDLPLEPNT